MQAVVFTGQGRAEIIELPRPALRDPSDAIVLVTTAAIGPWDIDSFLNASAGVTNPGVVPGGEFAGLVVETGADVSLIDIDDLVANTVQHVGPGGETDLFGSDALPGGHAEYVRVPDADTTLTRIAASGEERAVLAGGTAGLGVCAATMAVAIAPRGSYTVAGCDPSGMTALIALSNSGGGVRDRTFAIEGHPARRTLASNYAANVFESLDDSGGHRADVVIVGAVRDSPGFDSIAGAVKPAGNIIFTEPYGASKIHELEGAFPEGVTVSAANWPNVDDARKIVIDLQIGRIDLTPVVSHVTPFDEVQEAYDKAAGPGAGVQKVLLKP